MASIGRGGDLGFENTLWEAADKLRGNMDAAEYKHVVLSLIFLKYISDAFIEKRSELLADDPDYAEDRDEYTADRIFWVPEEARWDSIQAGAGETTTIGRRIETSGREGAEVGEIVFARRHLPCLEALLVCVEADCGLVHQRLGRSRRLSNIGTGRRYQMLKPYRLPCT